MKKINDNTYYCEDCKVIYKLDETDGLAHAYNNEGNEIGIISLNPEDYTVIGTSCPVCDGWEDGIGNSCCAEGWGGVD